MLEQLNRQPIESQPNMTLVQSGRLFQPIMAEMLGPLYESAILFFAELGSKIAAQVIAESPAFFFGTYLSSSSDSALFCFTIVFLAYKE